MNKKLFFVCPFSCLENFIREEYGNDVFFITSNAAIYNFYDKEFSAIKLLIEIENIQEIIFAVDTSCSFINSSLKNEDKITNHVVAFIKSLLQKNENIITDINSEKEKKKIIAKEIITYQINQIFKSDLFKSDILKNKIALKGIITTKTNKEKIEFDFK